MQSPARLAIALVAILVFAGGASGQDAADYTIDGIQYYFAAGSHTSGHMTFGIDPTGQNQTEFQGCAHMILRDKPEKNDVGRLQMIGIYRDQYITFDFNSFAGDIEGMDGGLSQDIYVDGSRLHVGEIQHPAVFAGMAGWGTGSMYIGPNPYYDPVTGNGDFQASMFITPQGFRDNATGAIYNRDGGIWQPGERAVLGEDDWEVHLRVETAPGPRQPDQRDEFERPPDAQAPPPAPEGARVPTYFDANEAYADVFIFDNNRFGGTATVDFQMEAMAPAGANQLTVITRDPLGNVLHEASVAPAAMSPDGFTASVPLDQFGKYSVQVAGAVELSRYTLTFTQHTPSAFDMDFWWDNATFGPESTQTLWDCQDAVGYPEEMVASVVTRNEPPKFDWVPIGLGIFAVLLAIVAASALVNKSYLEYKRK